MSARNLPVALPLLIAGLLCLPVAQAAETEGTDGKLPLWEVGAGAGTLIAPAYLGSSVTRAFVAPWPYAVYRGERLHANREGIGLGVIDSPRLKLDLSLSGALPVQSSGTAREGMRDLPMVGEIGPVLRYKMINEPGHQWSVRLPVRYGVGLQRGDLEGVGWICDPTLRGIESINLMGKRVDWGIDLSFKFQDKHFNNFYYQVKPSEVTAQRNAYETRGGYSGMTINTGLLARWEQVVLGGFVGVSELRGARFTSSPLVERKTNVFGGVAIFWILDKSSQSASYAEADAAR